MDVKEWPEWEPGPNKEISIAGNDFEKLRAEFQRRMEALAMGDLRATPPLTDRIKQFIKGKTDSDYMPVLRSKRMEFPDVQYARGAIDAFESLLEFLEENQ